MNAEVIEMEREVAVSDAALIGAIQGAEIDNQVTTARAFPRSLKQFATECREGALMSDGAAAACSYCLPRAGKNIEGPSIRFAEILFSSWGNAHLVTKIIEEQRDFVKVMAIFCDLQKNNQQGAEVIRRIVDKDGKRFNVDMIGVTIAAAQSIARRNVILSSIPKAYWADIFEETRELARGDIKSLKTRRGAALDWLAKKGVTQQMVCEALGVPGIEDIGLDELFTLNGMKTAMLEGTLVETVFAPKNPPEGQKPKTVAPKSKSAKSAETAKATETPPADAQTLDQAVKDSGLERHAAAQSTVDGMSVDQVIVIRDKLKESKVEETLLLAKFEVGTVEQIAGTRFKVVLNWIDAASLASK